MMEGFVFWCGVEQWDVYVQYQQMVFVQVFQVVGKEGELVFVQVIDIFWFCVGVVYYVVEEYEIGIVFFYCVGVWFVEVVLVVQ